MRSLWRCVFTGYYRPSLSAHATVLAKVICLWSQSSQLLVHLHMYLGSVQVCYIVLQTQFGQCPLACDAEMFVVCPSRLQQQWLSCADLAWLVSNMWVWTGRNQFVVTSDTAKDEALTSSKGLILWALFLPWMLRIIYVITRAAQSILKIIGLNYYGKEWPC